MFPIELIKDNSPPHVWEKINPHIINEEDIHRGDINLSRVICFVKTHDTNISDKLLKKGYTVYGAYKMYSNSDYNMIMAVSSDTVDEFSFVLQGISNKIVTDIAQMLCFLHGYVINSVWEEDELAKVSAEISKNNYRNFQNIYYQTYSILRGVQQCKTKYVIKQRADEYYSNMKPIMESICAGKITSNNVFARRISYVPYHISDHLFGGETTVMRETFQYVKSMLESGTQCGSGAEQTFALSFLKTLGVSVDLHAPSSLIKDTMKKYFNVISIKNLDTYCVVSVAHFNITLTNENSAHKYNVFVDVESIDDM